MKKGLFITIEGTDGSGKSTQIENIKNIIEEKGFDVLLTREPGGTSISEKIREIILDNDNSEMTPVTEALLYAASRAQHVSQVIRPAVERGTFVICDRFVDSSIAYQGFARGLGSMVEDINKYAVDGCVPDVTFLLKVRPEISAARISPGSEDRLESEGLALQRKVYEGYCRIEENESDRVIGIDAEMTIAEVSDAIRCHMERLLERYV